MAKKLLLASLLFAVALGGLAFAAGQADSTPNLPGPATTGDKLTLSGTVKVTNLINPVLSSGGKEYYLMIPRRLVYDVGVKDGAQVKIEGYQTAAAPRNAQADAKATYILVTKATVDGKDYDLSTGYGAMAGGMRGDMMSGKRGGMMDGRGNRW